MRSLRVYAPSPKEIEELNAAEQQKQRELRQLAENIDMLWNNLAGEINRLEVFSERSKEQNERLVFLKNIRTEYFQLIFKHKSNTKSESYLKESAQCLSQIADHEVSQLEKSQDRSSHHSHPTSELPELPFSYNLRGRKRGREKTEETEAKILPAACRTRMS